MVTFMKNKYLSVWGLTFMLLFLFLFSIFQFELIEKLLTLFIKPKNVFEERLPLMFVAGRHIFIVAVSSAISVTVALIIAIASRFEFMREFKAFFLSTATFAQSIPTVAVLALLVPFLGYSFVLLIFALVLYGIMPVLRNTIEGFDTIPREIIESARAVGMNSVQVVARVELPLILPAIIAGIKTSVILNISVATIGATVGIGGFGTLIVNGMRSNDFIMLLKGALPVSIMALFVDSFFISLEKALKQKNNYVV